MPVKTFTNKAEGIYYPMLEIIVKTVSLNIYSLFIAIEKVRTENVRKKSEKKTRRGESHVILFLTDITLILKDPTNELL